MAIAEAVKSGQIKALMILKENTMHLGISVEQLARLPALIAMNVLSNDATQKATVLLPACGFAEKRGSMINGKGRLQRLNRAVRPPGNARDDWEILRDLLQAVGGGDSLSSIDDVFRRISETVPQFAGLTLSKIGDLGVHILQMKELPPTHPSDEKAIEQAVAIQARRRAVRPAKP
jgi:NADH-quinone oxidoreductase subunit G